jgi:DNA repair exonuclease SbcCD ATPase subunit
MSNLQVRARRVIGKELVLLETARVARQEQERLSNEIAERDRLLSRKTEMLQTLEQLQVEAQGKKKADFEALLTSLIHDIIPGKKDRIVLTNGMRNNRASLDIDIEVDGNLENVDEDKGGSISNIVAMGLRFIVLARNPNRRVLMFDEADCHLSREYIPAFAAVLSSLAYNIGIQVLYISHHPISCFEGYGRIIQLQKESGKIITRVIGEEGPTPEDYEAPDSAIRYIRLKNYGPHQNTLVEFSPGLNIICGDVDLGKSKLITAIADLTVNNGQARRINHGKKSFEVEMGLEEGMTLHWSYKREGAKKTSYVLKDGAGVDIETSDSGTDVPPWLHTYLAMAPVNGENIHLHSQKDSSYLLSSVKYTSIERAQMLPLGRGSRDVLAMIQAFNTKLNNASADRKRLEKELTNKLNILATMSLILENPVDAEMQYRMCDNIVKMQQENSENQVLIDKLDRLTALSAMYDTALVTLDRQVLAPVTLVCDDNMLRVADSIERLEAEAQILNKISAIKPAPKAPVLSDLEGMAAVGSKINKLTSALKSISAIDDLKPITAPVLTADSAMEVSANRIESLQAELEAVNAITGLKPIKEPVLHDTQAMEVIIKQLEELEAATARGVAAMDACQAQLKELAEERQSLLEEMGGICPTCDSPLKDHSHD